MKLLTNGLIACVLDWILLLFCRKQRCIGSISVDSLLTCLLFFSPSRTHWDIPSFINSIPLVCLLLFTLNVMNMAEMLMTLVCQDFYTFTTFSKWSHTFKNLLCKCLNSVCILVEILLWQWCFFLFTINSYYYLLTSTTSCLMSLFVITFSREAIHRNKGAVAEGLGGECGRSNHPDSCQVLRVPRAQLQMVRSL